ncbi:MAG: holo-[acyl-carrier-protein] synthase [Spirochaetes bacterium GWD1_61_31]|nr:MAG: holo-[acyl-carrier-protein] synthase [Spirochaetes bacterium GWB1_60_80]OHD34739.1 MAG: holo-[acyl-carrier-protein] synthase [Spirochaetes bacterium GWC1_61_12]OHD38725.1 MAG: holo-[acyl-carrier-protein] synthase [Spirochaetes bacterium GWD1_61_31]OHD44470.1 MAG: holo-[acyl-carrier-protein] synthase [Spirochaetes bacterium GWE1_60_18]OHD59380.1 MAG: holo-[acyl-carrier-protein] synthase [Spirochaetes bacterium GWF1_60_12]HAP43120.1 holo-[acyl-carrier-protein] synthase [Spirochaetaceae b
MIQGIGVDIVQVNRMRGWLADRALMERFFCARELERLGEGAERRAQSLAARFAAKEAFGKALGTGLRGFALRDVWVENNASGRPFLRLAGRAAARLAALGDEPGGRAQPVIQLSLSHERDYAVAMVVIEVNNAAND